MNGEIKFENITTEKRKILLDILGYHVDEDGLILDKKTNKEHICPVTKEAVFIENASVLPGSTVIINTSELSLSEYFTKYVENITSKR
ncbi:MAG: hypothetical protein DDT42_01964 [candidate division WS2 bacterium]|uniref:Uncharacterized protein n=1 Tax=Psychracetigena formicireducens TaxID=2986056 RepID=A0A9E2F768_PSYF1|nr:hypothetical protein [Candidatus Psychracetigena formicireducens]